MAEGAIVFRWGPGVRGREQQSLQVFAESVEYFDDLVKNNRASGHYPYFSTNRSGGMWIVQGEIDELQALQGEESYQRLTTRVQMIVEDYSAEMCLGGSAEALGGVMGIFGEVIQDFD